MQWLITLIALGLVAYLAVRSLRSMRSQQLPQTTRPESQSAAAASTSVPESAAQPPQPADAKDADATEATRTLQSVQATSESAATPVPSEPMSRQARLMSLSQALQQPYDDAAHPQDLLEHLPFQLGVDLLCDSELGADQVIDYALGPNYPLLVMAAEALARRPDGAPAVPLMLKALPDVNVWNAFYYLRVLERHAREPVIAEVLVRGAEWWPRNGTMMRVLNQFIQARLQGGEHPDLLASLRASQSVQPDELGTLIGGLQEPLASSLRADLDAWQHARIDTAFLSRIGALWKDDPNAPSIIEQTRVVSGVQFATLAIEHQPTQSLLISGENGVGKTSLMRALAARLMQSGWTVFQASASDVLAGQSYVGELENRVRELITHLQVGKRVLWYIPAFHELYYAGRHRYSPTGLLDLLLPAVESGQICVIGEVEPQALEKILQQRPRLRNCFRMLQIEPLEADATLELARAVVERDFVPRGIEVAPEVLKEAADIARQYLGNRAQPGNLLDLLRETRARLLQHPGGPRPLGRDELLATLAQMTGLPRSVLDDREGLDPAGLRSFFNQHVMGQPEAVNCLVDRVAMLKAGLTDPARPIGVFLFAGPTGTGKTEVAKTLAQYLFGSVERMVRLDMSEFQDAASLVRIIGESGEAGETAALTNRIRKQPFSVVLLDEFEKAHPRIWDLFLQVFDDGRLTDAQGALADFRHSIIILTSNVGATMHQSSSLGFTTGAGEFGEQQVVRAIGQTFRPEFVNRIDRVIVFRPLSKSVMREVLKKELRNVMERRGFRNREWAVEWEDSAIEFLLEKGFTKDMGARPLRRAIDRYVLAPIAMTIVENRFPEGDQFLFVRGGSDALQVEFVDPDATAPTPETVRAGAAGEASLAQIVLAPRGGEAERMLLESRYASVQERLEGDAWVGAKEALLREMRQPEFWSAESRHGVLQKIEAMDAIQGAADAAQSLMRRLQSRPAKGGVPGVIAANLAQQLHALQCALRDLDAGRGFDLYLSVESTDIQGKGTQSNDEWPGQLTRMYQAWSDKRRMRTHVLSDHPTWICAISGPGAHSMLEQEVGLHVLELPDNRNGFDRVVARVRLVPQPVVPVPRGRSDLEQAQSCLAVGAAESTVVRRYRAKPSPLVRDSHDGWRSGRLDLVLGGNFDLMRQWAGD